MAQNKSDSELQQTLFRSVLSMDCINKEGNRIEKREKRKLWDALCLPVTGRAKCRDAERKPEERQMKRIQQNAELLIQKIYTLFSLFSPHL